MISLDGVDYEIKTPDENAADLVQYINTYCRDKDIRNSQGDVIYIDESETNPLYMLLYGCSYLTTILQKLIFSAGCSLDVASSSDRQLLNIASIAHVHRRPASKTTIQGTVYSTEEGTGCLITQSMSATITYGSYDLVFHPAFDVEVPVNSARQVVFICESDGSYNISENTITGFDEPVAGLRALVTEASLPGQEQETLASLRERIQRRAVEGTQMDRAAEAIEQLDGVSRCTIYFNPSATTDATVGSKNVVVPPRQALLMIQGYSDYIAETFYKYCICQTAGADFSADTGVYSQNYITKAQQNLPVYILPPAQEPLYVKIYMYEFLTYAQIQGIKDAISSLSSTLTIGQLVSAKMVTDAVAEAYTDLTIQGAEVSADGTTFTYQAVPSVDAVFIFDLDNITVVSAIED